MTTDGLQLNTIRPSPTLVQLDASKVVRSGSHSADGESVVVPSGGRVSAFSPRSESNVELNCSNGSQATLHLRHFVGDGGHETLTVQLAMAQVETNGSNNYAKVES